MRYLFDDKLAPITETIGFIETDCVTAANEDNKWWTEIRKDPGRSFRVDENHIGFHSVLMKLLPLVSNIYSKYLFLSTASNWTAFFDNGWQGTDAAGKMQVLGKRLGCRSMRVVALPEWIRTYEYISN